MQFLAGLLLVLFIQNVSHAEVACRNFDGVTQLLSSIRSTPAINLKTWKMDKVRNFHVQLSSMLQKNFQISYSAANRAALRYMESMGIKTEIVRSDLNLKKPGHVSLRLREEAERKFNIERQSLNIDTIAKARSLPFKHSTHGNKHMKHLSDSEAAKLRSMPKGSGKGASGSGQYYFDANRVTHANVATLERLALQTESGGAWIDKGNTVYRIYRAEKCVGYSLGQATKWMLVEVTNGVVHSHPIDNDKLKKYYPDVPKDQLNVEKQDCR